MKESGLKLSLRVFLPKSEVPVVKVDVQLDEKACYKAHVLYGWNLALF